MKYVALWFAVAFILALALAASLVMRWASWGFPTQEMFRRGRHMITGGSFVVGGVLLMAAVITVLYGVTRRLYRWAVK